MLAFICDFFGVAGRGLSEELGDIYDINDFFKKNIPLDKKCNIGNEKFSNGDIIFKNIYYKYEGSPFFLLENINLKSIKETKSHLLVKVVHALDFSFINVKLLWYI